MPAAKFSKAVKHNLLLDLINLKDKPRSSD